MLTLFLLAQPQSHKGSVFVLFSSEHRALVTSAFTVKAPTLFLLAFLAMVFVLRFPIKRLLNVGSNSVAGQRPKRNVTLMAFWAATFMTTALIWYSTIQFEDPNPYVRAIRIIGALLVVPSILMLEGVGLAVLELEDKEIPDKLGKIDTRQAQEIVSHYLRNRESYQRAREWCLAALIILLTMLVEFEKYHIPYVGTVQGPFVRTVMTVILATVAVIWLAQAPGKELGRESPLKFLSMKFGPRRVDKIIMGLSLLAKKSSIDEPSDVTAGLLIGLLPIAGEPSLPPGGARFFAELIKRYGYGDCDVTETYTIQDDGSCELIQTEKAYIGKGKEKSYVRLLTCEGVYAPNSVTVRTAKAYIVSALSASLDNDVVAWDMGSCIIAPVRPRDIKVDVKLLDPESRNGKREQTARITATLPDKILEDDQGFVLEIETCAQLPPGSFKGPGLLGHDQWVRNLIKPCYRATTILKLASKAGSGAFENVDQTVFQEESKEQVLHLPETERFRRLQREEDRKQNMQGIPTRDGVPDDGRSLTVKLTYGLPGAKYKVSWDMTDGKPYPYDNQLVPPPVMDASNADILMQEPLVNKSGEPELPLDQIGQEES